MSKLVAALIILILLLVFALQNYSQPARVRILFWKSDQMPLSIIIFASAIVGALIACIELVPYMVRFRRRALHAEAELARVRNSRPAAPSA